MRTIFSSVFAALLVVATPSLADAIPAEAEIAGTTAPKDAASLIAAELGSDVPTAPAETVTLIESGPQQTVVTREEDALLVASAPDVPYAAAAFAVEEQRRVAAALESSLFLDPNDGETQMLIAQDLASLQPEATGSVRDFAEIAHEAEMEGEAALLP